MFQRNDRAVLDEIIREVRRKIFRQKAGATMLRLSLYVLPLAALTIGLNQRFFDGSANWAIGVGTVALIALVSYIRGVWGLGDRVRAALDLDEHAHLKDRVSSAYEFLADGKLDEPRSLQIRDAIRHVRALNTTSIYHFEYPKDAAMFRWLAFCFI